MKTVTKLPQNPKKGEKFRLKKCKDGKCRYYFFKATGKSGFGKWTAIPKSER